MAFAFPQYTHNPLAKTLHNTAALAYILEQLSPPPHPHPQKKPNSTAPLKKTQPKQNQTQPKQKKPNTDFI